MAFAKSSFNVKNWSEQCPPELESLKSALKNLKNSTNKKKILDSVISVIFHCENSPVEETKDKTQQERQKGFINKIKPESYQLAALLCDQPDITYDELLIAFTKRKIANTYVPNHLPGNEPVHLPPAAYQLAVKQDQIDKEVAYFEKLDCDTQAKLKNLETLPAISEKHRAFLLEQKNVIQQVSSSAAMRDHQPMPKEQRMKLLKKMEQNLRSHQRRTRFLEVAKRSKLHSQTTILNTQESREQQLEARPKTPAGTYANPIRKLMPLQRAYFDVEALPKSILKHNIPQVPLAQLPGLIESYGQTVKALAPRCPEEVSELVAVVVSAFEKYQTTSATIIAAMRKEMEDKNSRVYKALEDMCHSHFEILTKVETQAPTLLADPEVLAKIKETLGEVKKNLTVLSHKPPLEQLPALIDSYGKTVITLQAQSPEEIREVVAEEVSAFVTMQKKTERIIVARRRVIEEHNFEAYKILGDMRHSLLKILAGVETGASKLLADPAAIGMTKEKVVAALNETKEAIREAKKNLASVLPQNPSFLFYLLNYKQKFPALFEPTNLALDIAYFDSDARTPYEVQIIDEKLHQLKIKNGEIKLEPFTSKDQISHLKPGWVSFVMNAAGEIFASSHLPEGPVYHSSFMSGGPVIFAGEMKVADDGTIEAVSNYSGHYGPDLSALLEFGRHLKDRKINIDNIKFFAVDAVKVNDQLNTIKNSQQPKETKNAKVTEIIDNSNKLRISDCYMFQEDGSFKTVNLDEALSSCEVKPADEQVEASSVAIPDKKIEANDLPSVKPVIPPPLISISDVIVTSLLSVLAVAGVGLTIATVFAFSGVAVPVVAPLLLKLAHVVTSPLVAYPLVAVVSMGVSYVSTALIRNVFPQIVEKVFNSVTDFLLGMNILRPAKSEYYFSPSVVSPRKSSDEEKPAKVLPAQAYTTYTHLTASALVPTYKDCTVPSGSVPSFGTASSPAVATKTVAPAENDAFKERWQVTEDKDKYPEWLEFIKNMSDISKENIPNYGKILSSLQKGLDAVTNRALQRRGTLFNHVAILKIWNEANITKVMNSVAEQVRSNPVLLADIETKLFKPISEKISSFWGAFDKEPRSPSSMGYFKQKGLSEFPDSPIQSRTSSTPVN